MYEQEIARLTSEAGELQHLGRRISSAHGRCESLRERLNPVAEKANLVIAGSVSAQEKQMIGGAVEARQQLQSAQDRLTDSVQAVRRELARIEAEIQRLRELQREEEIRRAARR